MSDNTLDRVTANGKASKRETRETIRVHPRGFLNECFLLTATGSEEIAAMKTWSSALCDSCEGYTTHIPNRLARKHGAIAFFAFVAGEYPAYL